MRTSHLFLATLAATTLTCLSGTARAVPVTLYFSGAFTTTTGLASGFAATNFAGQFSYDTDWVPIFTGGNFKQYRMPAGGLSAASFDGAVSSQAPPSNLINMVWGSSISSTTISGTGDYLSVSSLSDFTGSWQGFYSASLILLDVSGTALGPDLSAPPSLMGLANWTGTEFRIFDQAGGSDAAGALTCASTRASACSSQQVPEPGTLGLGVLALVGLGCAWRKRAA
jgi:hypothetical protein